MKGILPMLAIGAFVIVVGGVMFFVLSGSATDISERGNEPRRGGSPSGMEGSFADGGSATEADRESSGSGNFSNDDDIKLPWWSIFSRSARSLFSDNPSFGGYRNESSAGSSEDSSNDTSSASGATTGVAAGTSAGTSASTTTSSGGDTGGTTSSGNTNTSSGGNSSSSGGSSGSSSGSGGSGSSGSTNPSPTPPPPAAEHVHPPPPVAPPANYDESDDRLPAPPDLAP